MRIEEPGWKELQQQDKDKAEDPTFVDVKIDRLIDDSLMKIKELVYVKIEMLKKSEVLPPPEMAIDYHRRVITELVQLKTIVRDTERVIREQGKL